MLLFLILFVLENNGANYKHQFHPEIVSIQMPYSSKSLKEESKDDEVEAKESQAKKFLKRKTKFQKISTVQN